MCNEDYVPASYSEQVLSSTIVTISKNGQDTIGPFFASQKLQWLPELYSAWKRRKH